MILIYPAPYEQTDVQTAKKYPKEIVSSLVLPLSLANLLALNIFQARYCRTEPCPRIAKIKETIRAERSKSN